MKPSTAIDEPQVSVQVQEDFDESSSTEDICSDDSDEDPTFDIREETCRSFSKLSLKKSKSRIPKVIDNGNEGEVDDVGIKPMEFDESDLKGFEKVEKLIEVGRLEKLKIEESKLYLRKNGLRLMGNKDVLIQRIREHLGIINGGGEQKYPVSSFVLNCKGDACTGDIVMFEQNVYEMFSIASKSATGPPCGTRIVAGRIVKESYGAAKQQHTFTIEVLWSKGEKPLPPLHPLLIKGRNLYRLQTMRQRWDDEEKRRQVLLEKHSRGASARSNRGMRIQEKEMRKVLRGQRVMGKENNTTQEQRRQPGADTLKTNISQPPVIQSQKQQQAVDPAIFKQCSTQFTQQKLVARPSPVPLHNVSGLQPNPIKPQNCNVIEQKTWGSQGTIKYQNSNVTEHQNNDITGVENHRNNGFPVAKIVHCYSSKDHGSHDGGNHGVSSNGSFHKLPLILGSPPRSPLHHGFNVQKFPNENGKFPQRQPLHRGFNVEKCPNENGKFLQKQPLTTTSFNSPPRSCPLNRCGGRPMERQLCRYYPIGKCYYGDNCRYLHENGEMRREQRLPNNQRYYGNHNQ